MIEVEHLTKYYGSFPAVRDLSFSVKDRGIYGFLGVNGAGKSTTMNMITGCLAASSGTVKICGFDILAQPAEAKSSLGYLPENPPVYLNQTPAEYLRFVAEAKKILRGERADQIRECMELTQITDVADIPCRSLSKGYRQRVGISQALLGKPKVVILDEPTVGLDPKQTAAIRELIRSLREKCTVILSSHILSEIETVCDHVLILSHGKLAAFDTKENLLKTYGSKVRIELDVDLSREEAGRRMEIILPGGNCVIEARGADRSTVCLKRERGEEEEICRSLFFFFAGTGTAVTRMDVRKPSLEEIFLRLTRESPEA